MNFAWDLFLYLSLFLLNGSMPFKKKNTMYKSNINISNILHPFCDSITSPFNGPLLYGIILLLTMDESMIIWIRKKIKPNLAHILLCVSLIVQKKKKDSLVFVRCCP